MAPHRPSARTHAREAAISSRTRRRSNGEGLVELPEHRVGSRLVVAAPELHGHRCCLAVEVENPLRGVGLALQPEGQALRHAETVEPRGPSRPDELVGRPPGLVRQGLVEGHEPVAPPGEAVEHLPERVRVRPVAVDEEHLGDLPAERVAGQGLHLLGDGERVVDVGGAQLLRGGAVAARGGVAPREVEEVVRVLDGERRDRVPVLFQESLERATHLAGRARVGHRVAEPPWRPSPRGQELTDAGLAAQDVALVLLERNALQVGVGVGVVAEVVARVEPGPEEREPRRPLPGRLQLALVHEADRGHAVALQRREHSVRDPAHLGDVARRQGRQVVHGDRHRPRGRGPIDGAGGQGRPESERDQGRPGEVGQGTPQLR